jgi:HPt (histidine-containing phosphotransfer) domain-containing protein
VVVDGSSRPPSVESLNRGAIDSLLDLLGEDPEALVEVTAAFLEEAPLRISEVRVGVDGDDAVLAGRAAHTLKSNALTFGADGLADVARRLEEAARAGDLDAARPLATDLSEEWDRVRPLIAELCDRPTG